MVQAKRKTPERNDTLLPRAKLLEEFGVIDIAGLATLWGLDVRTLQNRIYKSPKDLPPYSKIGGKLLFYRKDVDAYMRRHMSR